MWLAQQRHKAKCKHQEWGCKGDPLDPGVLVNPPKPPDDTNTQQEQQRYHAELPDLFFDNGMRVEQEVLAANQDQIESNFQRNLNKKENSQHRDGGQNVL